jgi:hypothetical protein
LNRGKQKSFPACGDKCPEDSTRASPAAPDYLGRAGAATNGNLDITAAYAARLGQPTPGQKVFIVTCQKKNGWKAQDHVTSAIAPPRPT